MQVQVLIEVDEDTIKGAKRDGLILAPRYRDDLTQAIRNSIVLPKGHGRLIEQPTDADIAETIGGQNDFADCISREAALDDSGLGEFHRYDDYVKMRNYLKSLPPVTAQPKVGRWVKVIEENGHAFYLCSVCKEGTDENYDWCPFCGCKMQEVEND